jgi:hypothetical protein
MKSDDFHQRPLGKEDDPEEVFWGGTQIYSKLNKENSIINLKFMGKR